MVAGAPDGRYATVILNFAGSGTTPGGRQAQVDQAIARAISPHGWRATYVRSSFQVAKPGATEFSPLDVQVLEDGVVDALRAVGFRVAIQ
jgi:hypothetical protein